MFRSRTLRHTRHALWLLCLLAIVDTVAGASRAQPAVQQLQLIRVDKQPTLIPNSGVHP